MQDSQIIRTEYSDVMKKSYIDYAMSVIIARALPDVRDGLKPVQRRTLYDMHELGIRYDKPYRKCARIVGDTMGKYHPHGDSSIYDALVVMAQEFKKGMILVDGHGNFGSIEGDGAAAMRYTEARLAKITQEAYLADLDKDIVDFMPNFDETEKEPVVLPVRIPNLLVNGAEGIAVGMATSIPTHNLGEVVDGVKAYMKNEEITTRQLMKYIKGPDFPTGGIVVNKDDLPEIYETGTGKIKIRGKVEVEDMKGGKKRLVITEIPYPMLGANIGKFLNDVANLVETKKTSDIVDISNQSSKEGIRIVIEVKRDADVDNLINMLYKKTRLEDTFGVNMLALVNNEPVVMNLLQMLQYYLKHQEEVVTRRTKYDLNKAEERAHILKGLLIALDNIDEVIKIIRGSESAALAKERLIERFGLDDVQAQAIIDMRLRALTGLEREKLETEYAELQKKIAEYKAILADKNLLLGVIKKEILLIRDKYGDERRTSIGFDEFDISMEDLIPVENTVIAMSHLGYIKRMTIDNFKNQHRGGKGIKGMQTIEEDYIENLFMATTHHYLMFFTNLGKVYRMKAYEIPEASRTSRGTAIINLLQLLPDEKISAVISIKEFEEDKYLFMATKDGTVKKTPILEYANIRKTGLQAITLRDGNELIEVKVTDNNRDIFLVTKRGQCIRFNEKDVRTTGRTSIGVRGMKIDEGDEVVAMQMDIQGPNLLMVSEFGMGKRTSIDEFAPQFRGGKGVKCYKITEKTGNVIGCKAVEPGTEIMLITTEGIIIRIGVDDISQLGRVTSGVKLMNLDSSKDIRIASIARVHEEEADEDETEEESSESEE